MMKISTDNAVKPSSTPRFSTQIAIAFLVGGVAVLGWTPWAWWPIAMGSYSVLFWLLLHVSNLFQAFWIGLAFGLGLHGVGHSWVFSALHEKTGIGIVSSGFGFLLFVTYNAIFIAFPCCFIVKIRLKQDVILVCASQLKNPSLSKGITIALAAGLASAMTLGEYSRTLLFNGFTSMSFGFALIDTWFSGYAPIGGVYLVSWFGFFSIALILIGCRNHRVLALFVACASVGLGWYLSGISWVHEVNGPLSFRLLQINVPQNEKFESQYVTIQSDHLSKAITYRAADIIATPETAYAQYLNQLPVGTLTGLQTFSQRSGSHLLIGMATAAASSDGYNSVLHITPEAQATFGNAAGIAQYRKVRLMPFGEYSPAGFGWFVKDLTIQLKDLSAGSPDQMPFFIKGQRIGTLICHEDFVATDARRWVQLSADATILLSPNNFAWFEGSIAAEQHMQIARMRALEVGRPILRIANAGVTAHIDHTGQVLARLAVDKENVLTGVVQGVSGLTVYGRLGDAVFFLVVMLTALLCFLGTRIPLRSVRRGT